MARSIEIAVTGPRLLSGVYPLPEKPIRRSSTELTLLSSLPLLNDNGAGLAIAVATYIDDVSRHGNQNDENHPSENTKDDVKSNSDWLPKAPSLTKTLSGAFNLWDAVSF